ncbi:hypothetical protein D3C78_1132360 [compost metagenome]
MTFHQRANSLKRLPRPIQSLARGSPRPFKHHLGDLLQVLCRYRPSQHLLSIFHQGGQGRADNCAMSTEHLTRIDPQSQFLQLMPQPRQLFDGLLQGRGNRRLQR